MVVSGPGMNPPDYGLNVVGGIHPPTAAAEGVRRFGRLRRRGGVPDVLCRLAVSSPGIPPDYGAMADREIFGTTGFCYVCTTLLL